MLVRVPARVNLVFICFCLESVQPTTRSLRSLSKADVTPPHTKQSKSTPSSTSIVNGNIVTNDFITKQGFPDVIYPTSIYESGQPFYFKSGDYDNVLGPFSEDVKSTYKLLSSNHKKPLAKTSEITSEVKKDKTIIFPSKPEKGEMPSIVVEEDGGCSQCSDDKANNLFNETKTYSDILPKGPIYIDIIYNEGSPLESPTLELIPPYVPVRLKVNIEICKDDYFLQENLNLTECVEKHLEIFNETNKTNITEVLSCLDNLENSVNDVNLFREDQITVLDEINETDFICALSLLLFDSLNNKPIEILTAGMINTEVYLNDSRESTLNIVNDTNAIEKYEEFIKPKNNTETEYALFKPEEINILEERKSIEILEVTNSYEDIISDVHKNITDTISEQKNQDNTISKNETNVER